MWSIREHVDVTRSILLGCMTLVQHTSSRRFPALNRGSNKSRNVQLIWNSLEESFEENSNEFTMVQYPWTYLNQGPQYQVATSSYIFLTTESLLWTWLNPDDGIKLDLFQETRYSFSVKFFPEIFSITFRLYNGREMWFTGGSCRYGKMLVSWNRYHNGMYTCNILSNWLGI